MCVCVCVWGGGGGGGAHVVCHMPPAALALGWVVAVNGALVEFPVGGEGLLHPTADPLVVH